MALRHLNDNFIIFKIAIIFRNKNQNKIIYTDIYFDIRYNFSEKFIYEQFIFIIVRKNLFSSVYVQVFTFY